MDVVFLAEPCPTGQDPKVRLLLAIRALGLGILLYCSIFILACRIHIEYHTHDRHDVEDIGKKERRFLFVGLQKMNVVKIVA
jgi:hypothetical protein